MLSLASVTVTFRRRAALFAGALLCAHCGGATAMPPPLEDTTDGGPILHDGASSSDASGLNDGRVSAEEGGEASSPPNPPASCLLGASGAGKNCGLSHADDCCASLPVPGGSFVRFYDGVKFTGMDYHATLSAFRLDKYEITVGRFRQFIDAYPASKPSAGDGAHPKIPGSGWDPSWPLPADQAAFRSEIETADPSICGTPSGRPPMEQTWTDAQGPNEHLPINCVSWYELFAFCAWDGGRLPTDAEWNYASSGGAEERVFPWSRPAQSTTVDGSFAVYSRIR